MLNLKRQQARTPEQIRENINRAVRLSSLLASDGWIKDLEPLIREQIRALEAGSPWHPAAGMANCEAVALGCAYNGGGIKTLKHLLSFLKMAIKSGEEDIERQKKLRLEEPKK